MAVLAIIVGALAAMGGLCAWTRDTVGVMVFGGLAVLVSLMYAMAAGISVLMGLPVSG